MCRLFLTVLLATITAFAWADKHTNDSWCHGYIKKGLGEFPIEGLDRNNMWLAWNETVRAVVVEGDVDQGSYQAGRDAFAQQQSANNVQAMIDVTNGRCELGKNPTWVWW